MKIGILGTRGIPNVYGGFEELAEVLSVSLVERGHEVSVYCPHDHPSQKDTYKGVYRIIIRNSEDSFGTAGQFLYDLRCINHSRKQGFDILLQLGYTSNAIWHKRLPRDAKIVTNMDGLEWKRSKYSPKVQRFLKWSEKKAIESSHILVADAKGIQQHLEKNYQSKSVYIPYGSYIRKPSVLDLDHLKIPNHYNLVLARMEPENNIETILKGHLNTPHNLLVIGNISNSHGKYLRTTYESETNIFFKNPIYEKETIETIRQRSHIYFHGHSVGGTNPALLEAMASGCTICAHNNIFNREVLGNEAYFFDNDSDVKQHVSHIQANPSMIEANQKKISNQFNWDLIVDSYENLFKNILD